MTLTELIEKLEKLRDEMGCDGERVGSHNLKSSVQFHITNPEIDFDLELEDIDVSMLIGCGCWDGVIFNLKANCEHESDGIVYTTYPVQTRCKKCGEFYFE